MRAIPWSVLAVVLAAVPGCAAPVEDVPSAQEEPAPIDAPTVDDVHQVCSALGGDEITGEACESVSVCQAACVAAAMLGCGAVHAACGAGSVLTLGGVAIPCLAAAAAACATFTGGMVYCTDRVCGDS